MTTPFGPRPEPAPLLAAAAWLRLEQEQQRATGEWWDPDPPAERHRRAVHACEVMARVCAAAADPEGDERLLISLAYARTLAPTDPPEHLQSLLGRLTVILDHDLAARRRAASDVAAAVEPIRVPAAASLRQEAAKWVDAGRTALDTGRDLHRAGHADEAHGLAASAARSSRHAAALQNLAQRLHPTEQPHTVTAAGNPDVTTRAPAPGPRF